MMPYSRLPYCGCYVYIDVSRRYLPQLKVNAHTTILDTTSRTTLTQLFVNPYKDKALDEISYVFPLYDGVSVVAFTCTVAGRVIKGVVKERQKAKHEYTEAKARGEVAGLLEQSLEASDVFTTTIGNVPAGEKVKVEITYLGELKHDAEVDGVRFTIPTHIVPRYGEAESLESKGNWFQEEGISITVDAEMPNGSAIKSIQSPSHPISVSIGTTSTASASEEPSLRKASATLSQRSANLDKDFIVQVVATKMGEPAAFVETHPTIPNQRALMATLVPKFKLPTEKPEIVFICDRSGSMTNNIPDLVAALNIFLKSLPLGVKFNICSFGSRFSFLWSKSKTYSQDSLDEAVGHVNGFAADYGGTQMYEPLKEAFKKRYKDLNLEVFLLTDGEIWNQEQLFQLINEKVAESKGAVRIFSLGVGSGASTALIEGVARAGNGFAQSVGNDEKMDKKVVRMLKGALFPHITDYSLEIKYEKADTKESEEDDFEIVEKVLDSLSIKTLVEDEEEKKEEEKQPISLFDQKADSDGDEEMPDAPAALDAKYDHLPKVAIPRYLQTPSEIPPLYPFNRTTVYVLLSDSAPDKKPKSVLLKGTSKHGPLVLEIPIVNLVERSTTIHQLAARKEVKELEEGRGWLSFAKDTEGKLLRDKHEGQFSDMVEQEAVRLGVEFQVGGRWCSFVAVEESTDGSKEIKEKEIHDFGVIQLQEESCREVGALSHMSAARNINLGSQGMFVTRARAPRPMYKIANAVGGLFGSVGSGFKSFSSNSSSGSLFGSSSALRSGHFASAAAPPPPPPPAPGSGLFGSPVPAPPSSGGSLFGNNSVPPPPPPPPSAPGSGLFGSSPPVPPSSYEGAFGAALQSTSPQPSGGLFGAAPAAPAPSPFGASSGFGSSNNSSLFGGPAASFGAPPSYGYGSKSTRGLVVKQDQGYASMPQAVRSISPPNDESEDEGGAVDFEKKKKKRGSRGRRSTPHSAFASSADTINPLQALTALQTFVGSWSWDITLQTVLGITPEAVSNLRLPDPVKNHADKDTILATACAVMFFKKKLKSDKEAWEMLVDKAETWLEDQVGEIKEDLETIVETLF